jgi:A/G-specific adenine glycosylase
MKQAAQVIVNDYKGIFPKSYEDLQKLPGIGPYTAGAICAFAYNQPIPIIETNIRRVYIHHFFADANDICDENILKLVEQTLDQKNPREWYWALMDYGSFLGRTLNIKGKKYNPNVQSKHYTKQSKFEGSDRQIRGKILEILLQEKKQITTQKLFQSLQDLSNDNLRIKSIINQLIKENFIEVKNQKIWLKK